MTGKRSLVDSLFADRDISYKEVSIPNLTPNNIDERIRYAKQRRTLLKALGLGGAALGIKYNLSRFGIDIPLNPFSNVAAQLVNEIDIGRLAFPVKRDGQISPGEYDKDSKDPKGYQYLLYQPGYPSSVKPDARLFGKYEDDWTYFGFDIVGDVSKKNNGTGHKALLAWFDTLNNAPNETPVDAPGLYNLVLFVNPDGNGLTEVPNKELGTPLMTSFHKNQDYDYQYFFGPSALNPIDHTQIEFQIRTRILKQKYDIIGFGSSYNDFNTNSLTIPGYLDVFGKLKFVDNVFPDTFSPESLIACSLAATYAIKKIFGKKMSRRQLLGLPEKQK